MIVFPAVMLMLFAALQIALYGLGAHALQLAVSEAGSELRAQPRQGPAAVALLRGDVADLAGGLVNKLQVHVSGGSGADLTLSARGTVLSLLPGMSFTIAAASTGPSQVFHASG